jgi:hypothetical protein
MPVNGRRFALSYPHASSENVEGALAAEGLLPALARRSAAVTVAGAAFLLLALYYLARIVILLSAPAVQVTAAVVYKYSTLAAFVFMTFVSTFGSVWMIFGCQVGGYGPARFPG